MNLISLSWGLYDLLRSFARILELTFSLVKTIVQCCERTCREEKDPSKARSENTFSSKRNSFIIKKFE